MRQEIGVNSFRQVVLMSIITFIASDGHDIHSLSFPPTVEILPESLYFYIKQEFVAIGIDKRFVDDVGPVGKP